MGDGRDQQPFHVTHEQVPVRPGLHHHPGRLPQYGREVRGDLRGLAAGLRGVLSVGLNIVLAVVLGAHLAVRRRRGASCVVPGPAHGPTASLHMPNASLQSPLMIG